MGLLQTIKKIMPTFGGNGRPQAIGKRPRIQLADGFDTEKNAVATVEQLWLRGRQRMYPLLQQWCQNLLFFRGHHRVQFNDDEDYKWYEPEEVSDRIQITLNLCQKHVIGWVAKMTRFPPTFSVRPRTDDQADRDTARMRQNLVRWHLESDDFQTTLLDGFQLASIMGSSFLHPYYDSEAGEWIHPLEGIGPGVLALADDPQIQERFPQAVDLARLAAKGFSVDDLEPQGAVRTGAIPNFEVTIVDENPRSMRDVTLLIHSRIVSRAELASRYHDHPKIQEVKSDLGQLSQQLWFMQQIEQGIYDGWIYDYQEQGETAFTRRDPSKVNPREHVLVHTVWGARSRFHPGGVRLVVAGGVLLEPGNIKDLHNPYWHGRIPFCMLSQTADGVNFWPTSDLEQAINVQQEINKGFTKTSIHRDLCADPVVLDPEFNTTNWEEHSFVPNARIPVRAGQEPKWMEPPRLPNWIAAHQGNAIEMLERLFSDHKASQGISQPGDSGKKTRLLQDADELRAGPGVRRNAGTLREYGVQLIALSAQYTTREQMGRVLGEGGQWMLFRYDRQSLMGRMPMMGPGGEEGDQQDRGRVIALVRELDIRVSIIPAKHPETAKSDALQLVASGLLHPVKHREQILKAFNIEAEADEWFEDELNQERMAGIENDKLRAREPVPPANFYQDHNAHGRVHDRLINSIEFWDMEPDHRAEILTHRKWHDVLEVAEMSGLRQQYLYHDALAFFAESFGPLMPTPQQDRGAPPSKVMMAQAAQDRGGGQKPLGLPSKASGSMVPK